jgi:predicted ABC-type ATPase
MFFLAPDSAETSVTRVVARAFAGGHAGPPDLIRTTYAASLGNLPEAVRAFHRVVCYDTTAAWAPPREFAEFELGTLKQCVQPPAWFEPLFAATR